MDSAITTDLVAWVGEQIQTRENLTLVRTAEDLRTAHRDGKFAVFHHFQGPQHLGSTWIVSGITRHSALGWGRWPTTPVALMRTASRMRVDGGRSNLQQSMVKICSDARVIVDLSHTGLQRTMDTIEVSSHPVVLSHANALDKIDSPRNVSDEVLKAVAASGGFVSAVGYTPFVFKNKQPSMEDYVEMIDDMADRAGVDHVAIAVDCEATTRGITPEEDIPAMYEMRVVSGAGYPSAYRASPCDDPQGIAPPDNIHNLTAALLARGYTEEDLAKNWGGNWLRVMEQVWG